MDIEVNDYLIINNLIDYKHNPEHPYIYVDIYIINHILSLIINIMII